MIDMGCPIVYTALMTLDRGWTEILMELSKDIMQLFLELGSNVLTICHWQKQFMKELLQQLGPN